MGLASSDTDDGGAAALPWRGRRGMSAAAVAEAHVVAMKARLLSGLCGSSRIGSVEGEKRYWITL